MRVPLLMLGAAASAAIAQSQSSSFDPALIAKPSGENRSLAAGLYASGSRRARCR
jgi:hypothetical protein